MRDLKSALRKKFPGGPRDALRALGLDDNLILGPSTRPRRKLLAMDSGGGHEAVRTSLREHLGDGPLLERAERLIDSEPDEDKLRVALEELLAGHLRGAEYSRLLDTLENLHEGDSVGGGGEYEADENAEADEEERRDERRRAMATVADFLATRKGMSEDEIAETLGDYPKNGLENLGGALAEDLAELMEDRRRRARDEMPLSQDRRHRKMARDAAAFAARWPELSRIGDCGGNDYYDTPALAIDQRAAAGFDARWGDTAGRIKNAGGGW